MIIIKHAIAKHFFTGIVQQARREPLPDNEPFTKSMALIEVCASYKTFKRKNDIPPRPGGDATGKVDFRGGIRTNATHQSSTDQEAEFMHKGNGRPREA